MTITTAPRPPDGRVRSRRRLVPTLLGLIAMIFSIGRDAQAQTSGPMERPRYAPATANDTSVSSEKTASTLSWSGTLALGLAVLALGLGWRGRRGAAWRIDFGPGSLHDEGSNLDAPLRITQRVRLSGRHHACLVRQRNRVWLIGMGGDGAPSLLDQWIEEAERTTTPPSAQEQGETPAITSRFNGSSLTISTASPKRSA